MKRLMLGLIGLTTIAAAALPAAAQTYAQADRPARAEAYAPHHDRHDGRNSMFGDEFDRLQARVERSAGSGRLTRWEARNLSQQIDYVARVEQTYFRTDGRMTQWERQDMLRRIDRLKRIVVRYETDDDTRGEPGQR